MTTVYLAGGMRSDWRRHVRDLIPQLRYLEPSRDLASLNEYAALDLHLVKRADVVFGFMERENPAGHGLAVELGFAYALGKTTILVLEPNHPTIDDRYLAFMSKAAHVTFQTLDEGARFLREFEVLP